MMEGFVAIRLWRTASLIAWFSFACWMNAVAQQWNHVHDSLAFAVYDSKTSTLLEASPNGYRTYSLKGGPGPFIQVPGLGDYLHYYKYPLGDGWIMVNVMGGLTYHLSGSQISRLDKDNMNRMNIQMKSFMRRDTLFTQGGYGFWSARSLVQYFNTTTGHWQVQLPVNSDEVPPGNMNHWVVNLGDSVFTFGGHNLDAFDPHLHLPNAALWLYQMDARKWVRLGDINPALRIPDVGQITIRIGDKLLLYPVDKMSVVIDFRKGTVAFHEASGALAEIFRKRHPATSAFIDGDTYHYCRSLDNKEGYSIPHRSEWLSVAVSALPGKFLREEPLVKTEWSLWWLLLAPVTAAGGVLVLHRRKSADGKIKLTADGFRFRGTEYPASADMLSLVRLLLGTEGQVSNSAVMDLVRNPDQDYSHSIRMKNLLVEKTNLLLKSILQVEADLILADRSDRDKRVRLYSIRKEFFA